MSRKIKMSTVYGECLKLKNKYYDTDMALKEYHDKYNVRIQDMKKRLNRAYGKKVSNEF